MRKYFLIALTVFLTAISAFAQTTTGRLAGVVSSPDGVLPGATVTATDNNTGKITTVTTKEDGTFLIPQVEFGTYTVNITSSGFKTFIANEVKVDVGREYTLNATLEIGNVQESVTITAGADVLTNNTPQLSNTVSPQQILALPLITRNPLDLTRLQPGVASNSAQATVINGMRTTFTNITRDGVNIQDTFIRTNATDFTPGRPSVDDTSEFTITTGNSEADQGYGGAQIRLVTPRGTKNFSGALFAYNRNSEFAANSFFRNSSGTPRPFRNRNQFGGKLGGPLPIPAFGEGGPTYFKDKGFFFFAYEGVRDPLSDNFTRTILTPGARNGIFTFNRTNTNPIAANSGVTCNGTAVGSLCNLNILAFAQARGLAGIPSTIDPLIQSRVLSQLPTASNFAGGDGLNTAGFTLNRQQNQERDTYTTRFDVDATEQDTFNLVYSYNTESNLRPDADTSQFTSTPGVTQISTNKTFAAAYRRVFSANFFNEFRGGLFTSEVPFVRTDGLPSFFLDTATAGLVTFPENTFLNQGRNTKAFNIQDNADLIVGKHSLRFGGQTQLFKVNATNDVGIIPTFTIGVGAATPQLTAANFNDFGGINNTQLGTANGLLALLGGIVRSGSQSFNTTDTTSGFSSATTFQPFRYSNHALYVADRWQVNSQLTVYGGIRYELFPALKLNNGLALEPVIADPDNPLASLLDRNGRYDFIGTNSGEENTYYKTDYNNFAPSVGFAYSPRFENGAMKYLLGNGETVIRGGYSRIYGNDSIVTSINNAAAGNVGLGRTANNALTSTGNSNLNLRVSGDLPVIAPPGFITPPRSFLQNNAPGVGNFFGTVFAVDPKLETPMIEQYSFGIQREFFGNTGVEVRYVGTRSRNLARSIDYNQIDIFSNGFFADFERARSNRTLTGNPFCTAAQNAGCQALSIFQNGGTAGAGRLVVGTGGLALANFNNNLINATPADLATTFISNGFNNQPTSLNPTANPFVNFLDNPGTGVVNLFTNGSRYNYNSLQIEIRRRLSAGFYFQTNYTFSKNLTNAIGTSQQLVEPFLDNDRPELDNQRADFDQRHVFNFNGIYQLPFGKGRQFLNAGGIVDKIFGGFELSGLFQWTSGAPITFVDTRGTFNRAGRSARQTANSSLTNQQIQDLAGVYRTPNGGVFFINPSVLSVSVNPSTRVVNSTASNGFGSTPFAGQAFFNVNSGQTGNLGRTLISGPSYFNANIALLKNISFTERIRAQLRFETFNTFNNVNFSTSAAQQLQNINSTTFGQITNTFDPRQVQFAARFEF